MKNRYLVTRADDAGSCRSANEAMLEAVEAGIIKNVSFMACGPEIDHAVELLSGRDDIAYGFHVCINAEWEDVKWGPVSSDSGLVDKNGHFLPFPADTKKHLETNNIGTSEILREVSAQFEKLRVLGLPITYLDEHMGVSWIGFRDELAAFCDQHNLIDHPRLPSLPKGNSSQDPLQEFISRIEAADLDRYIWVTHPGKNAPDMQAFNLAGQPKGIVAIERAAEWSLLIDERMPELFRKLNVTLCRYNDI
jgi:hypothetical protein